MTGSSSPKRVRRRPRPKPRLLLLLLRHGGLGRLKPDLAVGPVTERLGDGRAAPAQRDAWAPARVHARARWVVDLHVPFDQVRAVRTAGDLHGHRHASSLELGSRYTQPQTRA